MASEICSTKGRQVACMNVAPKNEASVLKHFGMNKTFVDLNKVASYNSLYKAFGRATKGKKGKKKQVIRYAENLEENLKTLSRELKAETWIPDSGRIFRIRSEGKLRDIHTVKIEDRIVHQALDYHVGNVLRRKFIKRTYGSIKGRGSLSASKQVRRDVRSGRMIVIKLDIRKFYPNVNKETLKKLIRRKIKGEAVLRLIEKIIDSYMPGSDKGISIGALLSQTNGNYDLTSFDYFCLQELKVRYYVRYVDDIVILAETKEQAAEWIKQMKEFLKVNLNLELGKIEVFPLSTRKIDFCMYQTDEDNVKLRKRVLLKFIRKLKQFDRHPADPHYERSCVCSYLGFLKHCKSRKILNQLRNEYSKVFLRIDRHAARKQRKVNDIAGACTGDERVS